MAPVAPGSAAAVTGLRRAVHIRYASTAAVAGEQRGPNGDQGDLPAGRAADYDGVDGNPNWGQVHGLVCCARVAAAGACSSLAAKSARW